MTSVERRLGQTTHMVLQRVISATIHLLWTGIDLEAAKFRKVESKIDRKRLEKAERKIKTEIHKMVEYEAPRLIANPDSGESYNE